MLVWISLFVVTLFYGFFDTYIYSKISNKNIDFNIRTILIIILYSIISSVAIIILGNKYKMLLTILFAIILLKVLFNDKLSKIIIGFIIMYISFAISEAIIFILLTMISDISVNVLLQDSIVMISSNIILLAISYLFLSINKVKKIFIQILKWWNENDYVQSFIVTTLIIVIVVYLLYINFSSELSIQYAIFTLIFMLGIITFIVGYFSEKTRNNRLKYKYDELHNYAKTYETELAEKSKAQHEYRNQLIIVKNLIDSDTKEASLYIEKILKKDLNSKNLYWLNKLINIPYGGLKGLLYYKIMEMVNKKFEIYINISEELRKKSLWKIYEENAQDITRIIGVYIDNAIEAASISEDKFFILDVLYENNNIEFVFSNTYTNNIDINKIDKEGYSSKGKGRGYGLSLVKDILDNNSNLSQEREINGKFYVQKLIIKTK